MDLLGRATLATAVLSAALPEESRDLSAPFSGADFFASLVCPDHYPVDMAQQPTTFLPLMVRRAFGWQSSRRPTR
jgi:hypothetical protein